MSFLKTIAKLNNSAKGVSNDSEFLTAEIGKYMLNAENDCSLIFNKADSNLNIGDLSKLLNDKGSNIKDYQVLILLSHSAKLKATKAVELFTVLQKKVSLEKFLPMTDGLLNKRLEFYIRVQNWESLYKDCKPALNGIISKQHQTMAFR